MPEEAANHIKSQNPEFSMKSTNGWNFIEKSKKNKNKDGSIRRIRRKSPVSLRNTNDVSSVKRLGRSLYRNANPKRSNNSAIGSPKATNRNLNNPSKTKEVSLTQFRYYIELKI